MISVETVQDRGPAAVEQSLADEQDIRLALQGDGAAYAQLVARHQQSIAAYMWRFTRDHNLWEELVHDVFVEAYFSLHTFRAESPWSHWLKRIATRVGYRFWRQRDRQRSEGVRPLEEWHQPQASADVPVGATDAAAEVHGWLARLAPRDRLVLTLMYLEEHSVETIAKLTGWSRSMVKVQAHRARERLRKLMSAGVPKEV
ncbi:MAG: RNA polymerase sigma factor [Planctomycetota bacterium]